LQNAILGNVERGMRGLSKASPIKESPLSGREYEDLWITVPKYTFMAHLRHIAIRKPPSWGFKVVSDADLMTAWLATASLAGAEIFDADAVKTSLTHATLVDLVDPPELLIIRVGVKAARNEAMPEVLLEALTHREHTAQPTWLWDQPHHPLDGVEHLSYSSQVAEHLAEWPRLRLSEDDTLRRKRKGKGKGKGRSTASQSPPPGGRMTFGQTSHTVPDEGGDS
jgi:hypothetical protein